MESVNCTDQPALTLQEPVRRYYTFHIYMSAQKNMMEEGEVRSMQVQA